MNQLQIDKLQPLLNDELLLNTIRVVFNEVIEQSKPGILERENNELLGEKYRAYGMSKNLLNDCFFKLVSYKKGDKDKGTFDKAK